MSELKIRLTEQQLDAFNVTCFGYFVDVHYGRFIGDVAHCMLLCEITQPIDETMEAMWFKVGNVPLRFGTYEFSLHTGLLFGPVPNISDLPQPTIRDKFFRGMTVVTRSELDQVFETTMWSDFSIRDALRISLLYFLFLVFLGNDKRYAVEDDYFKLVDNLDEFNNFP